MKPLPETEHTLLIRTDYTNDAVWESVRSQAGEMDPQVRQALEFSEQFNKAADGPTGQPDDELGTALHIINDPQYANATLEEILTLLPPDTAHAMLFVADTMCIQHPDHPLLVVDLYDKRGQSFRTLPSEAFGIEANLSLANMDWDEFADNVGEDGIFRGF